MKSKKLWQLEREKNDTKANETKGTLVAQKREKWHKSKRKTNSGSKKERKMTQKQQTNK